MKMTVDLKEHSYPIYIERGILKEAAERIAEVYQGSKIMIIPMTEFILITEKRLRKIFLKNMSVRKP